jgi:hypothetical protein
MKTPSREIQELSIYLEGMADVFTSQAHTQQATRLHECSKWLSKLSKNICSQGYVGCYGGEKCTSDHK